MSLLVFMIFIVSVVIFSIVGFVNSVYWLQRKISRRESTVPNSVRLESAQSPQPSFSLTKDVAAAGRLLAHLSATGAIDIQTYQRLIRFLERKYDCRLGVEVTPDAKSTIELEPQSAIPETAVENPGGLFPRDAVAPIVEPRSVSESSTKPTESTRPAHPELIEADLVTAEIVELAPWERPDPPLPVPRRSLNQILSGFMQEKNMRWGELTSGILIVLSAVGLVVSLRDELSDAIPYFSSILFMLITAGIIGAGIYTLKKWKLRNTSRGTLVIGMLLIPLNFVAACVLSGGEGRRELSDPWLWFAMFIGFIGFGTMAWYAGKFLLRKQYWPLAAVVVGCGTGTILLNRLASVTNSSPHVWLLSLPLVGSFLVGTGVLEAWIAKKTYWSRRRTNRLLLRLGISAFAILAAMSLLLIRSETKMASAVALTPVLIVVGLIVSRSGLVLHRKRYQDSVSTSMIGLSLLILGLILAGVFLLASLSNPTVFVVNSIVGAVALLLISMRHFEYWLLPIVWALVAAGVLVGLNLGIGNFEFDHWTSMEQLRAAVVSGKSGLCLLACGAVAAGGQWLLAGYLAQRPELATERRVSTRLVDQKRELIRAGNLTGGAVFAAGCALAVLASLLNRRIAFDNFTATILLMFASLGALAIGVSKDKKSSQHLNSDRLSDPSSTLLLQLGSGLGLIALLHALIWNLTISDWFAEFIHHPNANWVWVFAIHGAVLALGAVWMPLGANQMVLQRGALVTTFIAVVGSIGLVPQQTGNATAVMIVVVVTTRWLAWTVWTTVPTAAGHPSAQPLTNRVDSLADRTLKINLGFLLATLLLVGVAIGELVSRFDWCPTIHYPRHWLIQALGVSVWSLLWTLQYVFITKRGRVAVSGHRSHEKTLRQVQEAIGFGLVISIAAIAIANLGSGVMLELFRDAKPVVFLQVSDQWWLFAALVAIATAMAGLLLRRPQAIKAAALILLWLLTWASGATAFASSQSVASAIRWLLPIGGLCVALLISQRQRLIPAWVKLRNQLRLSGRSIWQGNQTQRLINFSLMIVVAGVLLISTATVTQVMIYGGDALGGPAVGSWFAKMDKVVSFGGPLGLVVSTFLLFAISERRPWLATAGSLVFQYMVILAVVLLFLSPHPKLASAWFVRVLQSMSLGMTIYGFVWWWFSERISGLRASEESRRWSQIGTHTLINGLLVSSLAVLVFARFFWVPDQIGAWINSVGSLLGVAAWLLFSGLAWLVWRPWIQVTVRADAGGRGLGSHMYFPLAMDWVGLVMVATIAAVVDNQLEKRGIASPWLVFQILAVGAVIVGVTQIGWRMVAAWRCHGKKIEAAPVAHLSFVALVVGLVFSVRGIESQGSAFWLYESLIVVLIVLLFIAGLGLRRAGLSFAAAAVSLIGTAEVVRYDPFGWFSGQQPYWINLSMIIVILLSLVQLVFYIFWRRTKSLNLTRSLVRLPNATILGGSIWVLVGSCYQYLCSTDNMFGDSSLVNPLGIGAVLLLMVLLIVSLGNDRRKFWVVGVCLTSIGATIAAIASGAVDDSSRAIGVLLGCATVVMSWGIGWQKRRSLSSIAKKLGAVRLASLQNKLAVQLPVFSLLIGAVLVLGAVAAIADVDRRSLRYAAAAVPLLLAMGTGCLSNASRRRGLQLVSLTLLTLGALLVGWADLQPHGIGQSGQRMMVSSTSQSYSGQVTMLEVLVRGLIVLGGAMFVYGGLVTRWVRAGDRWLKSLREMAAVTCGLAIVFLGLVIGTEASQFQADVGCGLSFASAGCVAVVVSAMVVGLISIAVRPQRDPFSLPLTGRQAYVYVAQFVVAGLVAHLYFSLPWLFQIGLKEYWPYVAMAICFGGVGVAERLKKQNLTVLAQPLFATAAIFPVLIALAMLTVNVPAVDGALVMLTVGLAYLLISYLHPSIFSGAAAILFGNLALWMYYGRFPRFSFFEHPQLWLIPPAISVLIAGQLHRGTLTKSQLALLRYVCVAVIYVSSTSEIFISGLEDHLWPPMVLAVLSVGGIMAGILLQVRAFLYLGSLFLLTAMITMVSHAQQRLDHFWPWWAFGITLGIAILVMFGLFEKKKNEMKAVAERLREWES